MGVQEREAQLAVVEDGCQKIIAENTRLRNELENAQVREEAAQENWEPQIRWRDERYAAMVKEHEAIKEILKMEMLRAQETCKAIEEQVRRFPSPFEQELKEAEDKYAQSQPGLLKLSQDNIHLKEQIQDLQEEFDKEMKLKDKELEMAASILQQVSGLGALKDLSQTQVNNLEGAL